MARGQIMSSLFFFALLLLSSFILVSNKTAVGTSKIEEKDKQKWAKKT